MNISVRRLDRDDDSAGWCATLMAHSEPWLTLGRSAAESLALIQDGTRETYLGRSSTGERIGFAILTLAGPFSGYVNSLCIAPEYRGQGAGSALLQFAEQRIFAQSPNVFLCVSSFNPDARRLYERAGYLLVGELPDYLIRGHAELLFRKSRGPWSEFARAAP